MSAVVITVLCFAAVAFFGCFFLALCRDQKTKGKQGSVQVEMLNLVESREELSRVAHGSNVGRINAGKPQRIGRPPIPSQRKPA